MLLRLRFLLLLAFALPLFFQGEAMASEKDEDEANTKSITRVIEHMLESPSGDSNHGKFISHVRKCLMDGEDCTAEIRLDDESIPCVLSHLYQSEYFRNFARNSMKENGQTFFDFSEFAKDFAKILPTPLTVDHLKVFILSFTGLNDEDLKSVSYNDALLLAALAGATRHQELFDKTRAHLEKHLASEAQLENVEALSTILHWDKDNLLASLANGLLIKSDKGSKKEYFPRLKSLLEQNLIPKDNLAKYKHRYWGDIKRISEKYHYDDLLIALLNNSNFLDVLASLAKSQERPDHLFLQDILIMALTKDHADFIEFALNHQIVQIDHYYELGSYSTESRGVKNQYGEVGWGHSGLPLLAHAVKYEAFKIIEKLLDLGADPFQKSYQICFSSDWPSRLYVSQTKISGFSSNCASWEKCKKFIEDYYEKKGVPRPKNLDSL